MDITVTVWDGSIRYSKTFKDNVFGVVPRKGDMLELVAEDEAKVVKVILSCFSDTIIIEATRWPHWGANVQEQFDMEDWVRDPEY